MRITKIDTTHLGVKYYYNLYVIEYTVRGDLMCTTAYDRNARLGSMREGTCSTMQIGHILRIAAFDNAFKYNIKLFVV